MNSRNYVRGNRPDQSQVNVNNIALGINSKLRIARNAPRTIAIDQEVQNLLDWLAQEQGISPEVALKKAVVTAAYIYDLTNAQKAKLLAQNQDNSISEIILN